MIINGSSLNIYQHQNILNQNTHIILTNQKHNISAPLTVNEESYSVQISDESIQKQFEDQLSINQNSDGDDIQQYVDKYMKIRNQIETEYVGDKASYVEQLDKAFDHVIEKAAATSSKQINRFLSGYLSDAENKFQIDEEKFKDTYIGLANKLKELNVNKVNQKNIDKEINTYFSANTSFGDYDDYKLLIGIGSTANQLQKRLITTATNIINSKPSEIIYDNYKYNQLINDIKQTTGAANKWQQFSDRIKNSSLPTNIKDALTKAYDRTTKKINQVSENASLYSKYLEEYKKLDEKLKKLQQRYEKYNERSKMFAEQKNIERSAQVLVQASEIQNEISTVQAKKSELEAKMAKIQSSLKDQIGEMSENVL